MQRACRRAIDANQRSGIANRYQVAFMRIDLHFIQLFIVYCEFSASVLLAAFRIDRRANTVESRPYVDRKLQAFGRRRIDAHDHDHRI